jgi:hypothetical protein
VLTAKNVHYVYQSTWSSCNVDKLKELKEYFKAVKLAIMQQKNTENLSINPGITKILSNTYDQILPKYLDISIELPTPDHFFNGRIWYYIYRAMMPRSKLFDSTELRELALNIFVNLRLARISQMYIKHFDDAGVRFKKKYPYPKNYQDRSGKWVYNDIHEKNYKEACNKEAIGNYEEDRKETLKQFKEMNDFLKDYQEKPPEIQSVIKCIITLNPACSAINLEMKNLIRPIDLNIQKEQNYEQYPQSSKKLLEWFYNKHPDFKKELITEEQYKDWLLTKTYTDFISNTFKFMSSTKELEHLMMYDNNIINIAMFYINHFQYKPNTNDNRLYYGGMCFDDSTRETSVLRRLNKINDSNLNMLGYELMAEPTDTVVRLSYDAVAEDPVLAPTILKLFEFLAVTHQKPSRRLASKIGYPILLVIIFYSLSPEMSLEDYFESLEESDETKGNFLWKLWNHQNDYIDKFVTIQKPLERLIEMFSERELTPKLACLLGGILQDIKTNTK